MALITLVVENGTGDPRSNAYVSEAFFRTYVEQRGYAEIETVGDEHSLVSNTSGKTFEPREQRRAIIRASDYLTEGFRWKGLRLNGRRDESGYQGLAWPRQGVFDDEGAWVNVHEIPREVRYAACELAWFESENPHAMQPTYQPHERITMLRAEGVAITYDSSRVDAQGVRPVLLTIGDLIGRFLKSGGSSNPLVGAGTRSS